MGSAERGRIDDCVQVQISDDGAYLRISPDGRRFSLAEVIAHVLSQGLSGVNFESVAAAYQRANGLPVRISTTGGTTRRFYNALRGEGLLVVSADPRVARSISNALLPLGLPVRCVESAQSAIEQISAWAPDLIVMTHPVGDHDGVELVRQVRSHSRGRETEIVLMPSVATRDQVINAIRAGVTDIAILPVDAATLLRKVTRIFRRTGKEPAPEARQEIDDAIAPVLAEEQEIQTDGKVDPARLASKVNRLLAVPAVVHRVLSITMDTQTGARDLANAVQSDPAVSATVLRRGNSVTYGTASRTFNVQECVIRLGFAQTRSIVVAMSMIRLFSTKQKTASFNRLDFWVHSLAAATAAKLLSSRAGIPSDMAFSAALLHDLGKIVLDEYASDGFEQASMAALRQLVPMRAAEENVLGVNHATVGGVLLDAWRFPSAIVGAVTHHHGPLVGLDRSMEVLCRLVQVANLLAKALGEGHGGDVLLEEMPSSTWEALGLGGGLPPGFMKAFDAELVRSEEFLETSIPRPASLEGEYAAIHYDETPGPVSVLGVTLDRLGVRRIPLPDATAIARVPAGEADIALLRASTFAGLERVLGLVRAAPSLADVPVIGILPQGQIPGRLLPGVTLFVEPYDRLALVGALQAGG